MADTVRYGLISTARIGFSAHVPAALASANSEIVAVSSRDLATAEAAAKQHGIPLAFGSYQEMIDSDEIDAVINTLPNSMHHEWTIKAAEAGKHILCEKPLSATMAEGREMKAAAEANEVVLVEAFTPRWTKQNRTVRQLIADGEIGEVTYLESSLAFRMGRPDDIRLSKPLAGGSLMDVGCYAVYAVRYAMGVEPVSAMAFDRKRTGVAGRHHAERLAAIPEWRGRSHLLQLRRPATDGVRCGGNRRHDFRERGVQGDGARDHHAGRRSAGGDADDQPESLRGADRRVLRVRAHRQAAGVSAG